MAKMNSQHVRRGGGVAIDLLRIVLGTTTLLILAGCSKTNPVVSLSDNPVGGGFDATFPIHQDEPAWSRQNLIAYHDRGITCVFTDGSYLSDTSLAGLWIADVQAGSRRRLLPFGHSPAWSPDGSMIAFEHEGQIYTVQVDGHDLHRLTFRGRNYFPSWLPDGAAISYDSNLNSPTGLNRIWIANRDGTNAHLLCSPTLGAGRMSNWASDGGKVAMISYPSNGSSEISEVDTATCSVRVLTHDERTNLFPRYSNDGSKFAFSSYGGNQAPEIWTMSSDGTSTQQLTINGGTWPTWSPDGTKLAYVRIEPDRDSPDVGVIWVIGVDTGTQHKLTSRWPSACQAKPIVRAANGRLIIPLRPGFPG